MRKVTAGKILALILLIAWIVAYQQDQPKNFLDTPPDSHAMTLGEFLVSSPAAITVAMDGHDF